ncbi:LOW QUALITY PROTEIN: tetrahydroanabasine acetyltransferase-like [Primulina huaijiensis]|uniref:LOW QUALITY PROTEIN: tetrahydroanabasine acetyltransferase-like n=1 Tax=Primulina huaijiensis TaxID=1492673 RepID=UPI003CC765B2
MQVHIQETAVVPPSKPPFDGDQILPLSNLDLDRNNDVILRYLRVYANHHPRQQPPHPFQVITVSLSAALVPYYPFAGKLRRRAEDGLLELHCHLGDGVPVVSAVVDCQLSSIDYLDGESENELTEQLVPNLNPNEDVIQPMMLQVTRFGCGGFVLGAAIHHAICDGLGATLFFNAMAELASGSGRITTDPVWNRSTLLGPRKPARVEFRIDEFLKFDRGFSPYLDSGKRALKECFNVKEDWLYNLKGLLYQQSGIKFTTFEALGAFIWRARTKSSEVPGEERVTFAYSINVRKIVNPPLPNGYWGNGCVPIYIPLLAKDVAEQPIWKTADSIKKSKLNATDEYVRSFIDFQELHYAQGVTAGPRVSGFTDWRHLGHSTMDFGWGGPVAVVPLSRRLLGSTEPCFFLPGKEGGGMVKVLLHLDEDAIPGFRQEMGKLKNLDSYDLLSAL